MLELFLINLLALGSISLLPSYRFIHYLIIRKHLVSFFPVFISSDWKKNQLFLKSRSLLSTLTKMLHFLLAFRLQKQKQKCFLQMKKKFHCLTLKRLSQSLSRDACNPTCTRQHNKQINLGKLKIARADRFFILHTTSVKHDVVYKGKRYIFGR